MKILFIGDIVGGPGRRAVSGLVPELRQRHKIDVVIANGENSAGGSGITPKTAQEIFYGGSNYNLKDLVRIRYYFLQLETVLGTSIGPVILTGLGLIV